MADFKLSTWQGLMRRWETISSVGSCGPVANTDSYLHSWHKPLKAWRFISLIYTHTYTIHNTGCILNCYLTPLVGLVEPCNQAYQFFSSKNALIFTILIFTKYYKEAHIILSKLSYQPIFGARHTPKNSICRTLIFRIMNKFYELWFYLLFFLYVLWTWSLNFSRLSAFILKLECL